MVFMFNKSIRFIWRCCARVFLSVVCATTIAQALFAQVPIDLLEAHLSSFSAWSGTFDQTVMDESGQTLQQVSGVLDIQKPMQFYWQTQDPFPQLVISNGNTLWVYDQDLEQVVVREMNAAIAPLPAAILSGETSVLKDLFQVDAFSEEKQGVQLFTLSPKGKHDTGEFEALNIEFKAGQLQRLQLQDALGQTTVIEMASQVSDPKLESSRFEFTPPVGADVIDERPHQ